jgi:RecA/RadA recombinase
MKKLTTGIPEFDRIINGIECGSITQIFGEFGTGKSIIAQQLCVTAQLPENKGGLESKSIFISTEKSFYPPRIEKIAIRFNLQPSTVLKNIFIKEVSSLKEQILALEIAEKIIENYGIKLLIIDSISAFFRSEFAEQNLLALRQHEIRNFLERLISIAEKKEAACVVTNQVTEGEAENRWEKKPVGGNLINKYCRKIIELGKIGNKRYAKLYDSPNLDENYFLFEIREDGIYPA